MLFTFNLFLGLTPVVSTGKISPMATSKCSKGFFFFVCVYMHIILYFDSAPHPVIH